MESRPDRTQLVDLLWSRHEILKIATEDTFLLIRGSKGTTYCGIQRLYVGKWYEVEATPQIWEIGGKCPRAEYSLNSVTGLVDVKNSMTTIIGVPASQEGTADLIDDTGAAKLLVTFNVPLFGIRTSPYWVVSTDYVNYSVVYSCSDVAGFLKIESGWILSRAATLAPEVEDEVQKAVEGAGLKRTNFEKKDQSC